MPPAEDRAEIAGVDVLAAAARPLCPLGAGDVDLDMPSQMPVQVIFAGKAHPQDGPGKTVLQQIADLTRDPRVSPAS